MVSYLAPTMCGDRKGCFFSCALLFTLSRRPPGESPKLHGHSEQGWSSVRKKRGGCYIHFMHNRVLFLIHQSDHIISCLKSFNGSHYSHVKVHISSISTQVSLYNDPSLPPRPHFLNRPLSYSPTQLHSFIQISPALSTTCFWASAASSVWGTLCFWIIQLLFFRKCHIDIISS